MLVKQLRFLERVAVLFEAGIPSLLREDLADIEQNGWKALSAFLGYAYARQGVSPAYAPAAQRTVGVLVNQGASWEEYDLAQRAWRLYLEQLEGLSSNERNNPMCPKGTSYWSKRGEHKTRQRCVIEFVQERLSGANYNILRWAEKKLKTGDIRSAHEDLTGISGMGRKIASLFLRDVAWVYGVEPDRSRELLQPIDVWMKRYIRHWGKDDSLSEKECARWIVKHSLQAKFSPEKVNAGMWYFGAQVARDEYTLRLLLDDVEAMQTETAHHVKWMASRVAAWHATKGI